MAVLDWELTSIGDARADLAYNCLPYHIPSMARPDGGNAGFAGDLPEGLFHLYFKNCCGNKCNDVMVTFNFWGVGNTGIPSEEEYTRHYARARNLAHPIPHFSFFLALSFFRLASIAHVGSWWNTGLKLAAISGPSDSLLCSAGRVCAIAAGQRELDQRLHLRSGLCRLGVLVAVPASFPCSSPTPPIFSRLPNAGCIGASQHGPGDWHCLRCGAW